MITWYTCPDCGCLWGSHVREEGAPRANGEQLALPLVFPDDESGTTATCTSCSDCNTYRPDNW